MKAIKFFLFVILFSNNILSQNYFFSFENTYSVWDTVGIDLELGDTTIAWAIHPSSELSSDSSFSMQYYLGNFNDAGKIWIQKSFDVLTHRYYSVNVDYKFATRYFGMANLWTIITGVHLLPPTTAQELTYQGHTGNGYDFDTGYVWLDKNYEFDINSGTSTNLWVVVGIWGNWEVERTYYIDAVSIHIQEDSLSELSDETNIKSQYYLCDNFPNPFNPGTTISWQLPKGNKVTLKIFNTLGEEISTLVENEYQDAGTHSSLFIVNSSFPSGVYFYQLRAGDPSIGSGQSFIQTKKMILLK